MLEAHAHNQLKILLQRESSVWSQNLTLSRLVARSLRRKDKSLIELPVGSQDFWWPGLIIPLCVESSDAILVISESQRQRLINFELPRLKNAGFDLPLWEGTKPPPKGKVWLMNYLNFITSLKQGHLASKQLIFPEADLLSRHLRDAMSIAINHIEWEQLRRAYPPFDNSLLEIYQLITRRLFVNATREDDQIAIDNSELIALQDVLTLLEDSPNPWPSILHAIHQGWATWAQLNHKLLDWKWHLQPLTPFKEIQCILKESPVLMLTGSWNNDLLNSELQSIDCSLNVSIRLGGMINQEAIQLFVPFRQPLPNTEYFAEHLLDQSRRLILGIQGITILLLDDYQLRKKLTSQLAAEFGLRVVHQGTSLEANGVVCCSSSWWLKNYSKIPTPHQLIFAILPFASLESPLLAAQVNECKKQGRDWFRDLLLPDVLSVMPYAVHPIRSNQGRVAILDGRLRSRSWGDLIFRSLEPWTPLERLLPN